MCVCVCVQFKLQGATLDYLVLSVSLCEFAPPFSLNGLYVLASCVRTSGGLFILEAVKDWKHLLALQHPLELEIWEGSYPNKVFDYMAAAKPIIIGIDGVARELIEDAGAGIYAEPENSEEFIKAIVTLKEASALCERYGQNGRSFVTKHFARDVLAKEYLDILPAKVVTDKKTTAIM